MAQRALRIPVRRLAAQQPAGPLALQRFIRPSITFTHARFQSDIANPRAASVPANEGMKILENQRLHRPVAPHLGIYKPQISWVLSMLNRLTGIVASGGFYLFGLAYLASPLFGWKITTAAMAAGFAKWPVILQFLTKFGVSWPFWFHSFNGLRHLVWDMGKAMTNIQVIRTGWTVLGLTTIASLGVAFI